MRPVFRLTLFAIVAAAVAGLLAGALVLDRRSADRARTAGELAGLRRDLSAAQRELAATTAELAIARRQLDAIPSVLDVSADTRARSTFSADWVGRVKHLRTHFETHPAARIPEMRLLTDGEWLLAARDANFDSEDGVRRAAARVRDRARLLVAARLARAAQGYSRQHGLDPPSSPQALAPFLTDPADAEFLARTVLDTAAVSRPGIPSWRLSEATAVDHDHDGRYHANGSGSSGMSSAPTAWIPDFSDRMRAARAAYSAAHAGDRPPGLQVLLPFFQPALDPAVIAKIVAAEQARNR
jgi:hypothetical protein